MRHASAANVILRLDDIEDTLRLVVSDDGAGFDSERARMRPTDSVGLFGMAERAALVNGALDVISREGAGTRIEMRVPLRDEDRP